MRRGKKFKIKKKKRKPGGKGKVKWGEGGEGQDK
jgi:hypothetical protein